MASILVVEDDPTIRDVVVYQLQAAGHDLHTADDGVDAVDQFRANKPDLVILDLMLPRLPGLDVLRILRRESTAPVIVTSARTREADKLAGFELGADDYVTKPFGIRELLARVEANLKRTLPPRRTGERAPSSIDVDDGSHTVRRHGERVALTPKEFELLSFLVRHPNQVCSRDLILESAWGYAYPGETRTVDVHMHWLRQKLEDNPVSPAHLITVRNYGYMFVPDPA
ncbi:MAG: response regulator transcription factor [Chloroflexi bacterium]|nr:response regulator transcription factor [Chloroflexota bacterium]MDA1146132.1 response regulator transcription factor [Chloroflexota bacterium]